LIENCRCTGAAGPDTRRKPCRPDRQHVLAARRIEALAQLAVIAIGLVAEHRGASDLPADGSLEELHTQLVLGLELELLGTIGQFRVCRRRTVACHSWERLLRGRDAGDIV
jgi:hypothetical protein